MVIQWLKKVPPKFSIDKIELDLTIYPSHQSYYFTGPTYAKVAKELYNLISVWFIQEVDEANWFPQLWWSQTNAANYICELTLGMTNYRLFVHHVWLRVFVWGYLLPRTRSNNSYIYLSHLKWPLNSSNFLCFLWKFVYEIEGHWKN